MSDFEEAFFDHFGQERPRKRDTRWEKGLFLNEPRPEPPRELTHEELVTLLGAEPIKNGPTKKNHLAYCKQRALEYAPESQPGDAGLAMSSLLQDFGEDPRTASSVDVVRELMFPLAMTGEFASPGKLRKWILDFN